MMPLVGPFIWTHASCSSPSKLPKINAIAKRERISKIKSTILVKEFWLLKVIFLLDHPVIKKKKWEFWLTSLRYPELDIPSFIYLFTRYINHIYGNSLFLNFKTIYTLNMFVMLFFNSISKKRIQFNKTSFWILKWMIEIKKKRIS